MNKKPNKIPQFKTDMEAAEFWDAHDSTDYLSQTKPVCLKFPKPKHKVVVTLGQRQWKKLRLKIIAHQFLKE